ncbi:nodulation protein NodU (plasmid) [Bradyrhizobium sp. 62B]|uniref:nodulation protein NodU n=1 Tax=Bradyrhizobium sp. 62B TaxID=2898442 RepID=UPI002557CC9D|nr:nodulation protein NodU [Bradyrhizobium sp. 62B]
MRICGIKLTHDGAISLVEDGRLIFCIEQEKRGNNKRYKDISDLDAIVSALVEQGVDPQSVDQFVIDGWIGDVESQFDVLSGGIPITLKGASYLERHAEGLLSRREGAELMLDGTTYSYASYPHVASHVASSYCTSPFAEAGQPALCMVWDGSTFPRLYYVGHEGTRFLECLFPVTGHAYASAGHHFGPYKRADRTKWDLGIAGKLMAYIALGSVEEDIVAMFQEGYADWFVADTERANLYKAAAGRGTLQDHLNLRAIVHDFFDIMALRLSAKEPEDVLASFHCFLERLLVDEMANIMQRYSDLVGARNLCIGGGCGLNIKWNSALRATDLFDAVWVPPFPNDSGSAIGAACCAMAERNAFRALEWSVYSGPALRLGEISPDWQRVPCSTGELAMILARQKPVVFLSGRAELGPRALGGRSIIAAATSPSMKDHLNDIKLRERFRPVAPICLEDRATEIFCPGTPDAYMLFDHQTRTEWRDRIPAVLHLDGSARLQTISRSSQHPIAELLIQYERLTGIPVLCNTSANHHGRGFFPDVAAACQWGRVENVWCDGQLWTKKSESRR